MSLYRFFYGFSFILIFAATAVRADLALVIGNRNYQRVENVQGAEKAQNSAAALRRAGYAAIVGRNAGADQTQRMLDRFLKQVNSTDRAVVVLNGHFVQSASDTWLLAADAVPDSLASMNYNGLSLRLVLDILARKPGGAVLFLGFADAQIDTGLGLVAGIGELDIPQGVLVVTGTPVEIDQTIRRDFLQPGAGYLQALANAPDSVVGQGFVSDLASLLPVETPQTPDTELLDEGYWQAVQDIGSEEMLRAYLRAFPQGARAAEARARLDALSARSPQQIAREAEAALGLNRNARRKIQTNLTTLGFDTRGIDGLFGRATRSAISRWQRDRGYDETGYMTARLINRLERQAERRTDELAEEARQQQRALERQDQAFWFSSGASEGREEGLLRYLERYPQGLYSELALDHLNQIEAERRNNISAIERQTWEEAENANSVESYAAYLSAFPDGAFAEDARLRLQNLEAEAAQKAVVEAAKNEERAMNLNGFGRLLVEQQLAALGISPGIPDGRFDKQTRKALREFQRTRGFPVTGYLTQQTVVRLIAEAG